LPCLRLVVLVGALVADVHYCVKICRYGRARPKVRSEVAARDADEIKVTGRERVVTGCGMRDVGCLPCSKSRGSVFPA